ncbi:restriction endonuclease subunit S [Bacillus haynesii]|nr:restriction endonuclease subunit S [Bacillus haynesii]
MENKRVPELRFAGFAGDWEERKLGELVEIKSGWTPSDFVETQKCNGEIYIKVDDLNYSTRELLDSKMKVAIHAKYHTIKKGSTIFPKRGAAIMTNKVRILGTDGYMDTNMMALEPRNINGEFLYTLIDRTGLFKIADTSTIPQINNKHVEPYKILLPNLYEQKNIGNFFKQLDDTIALHQQELTTLKQTKQGFLQKMFPKEGESVPEVRFPGFTGEWEQRKADEIFYSVSDKNHSNLPVLSATQEKGMVYRDETGLDINYDVKSTKNYKRVLPGQFVIHLRSFQGGFAFSNIEGITSPAYTVLDFKNKEMYYSLFWRCVLASDTFIKRLEAVTYGIRDGKSISFSDFSTLKFRVPSHNEQLKIGKFFKQLDDTIALHQCELDTLKETKKAFLQKMFV